MINYSIAMRSVNQNLFEINCAKSRINAAKAAGESPKSEDTALVATEVKKAFAIAQYSEIMTIEKFAQHIADHGCVYSRADISAILYMAVDCMREQLLAGKKIRLGDLGDFSVNLSSNGADNAKMFNAEYITDINVVWDAGKRFTNLIKDAEFNLVASRAAQAAVLKALKSGKNIVDISGVDSAEDTNTPNDSGSGSDQGNKPQPGGSSSGGSGSSTDGDGDLNLV